MAHALEFHWAEFVAGLAMGFAVCGMAVAAYALGRPARPAASPASAPTQVTFNLHQHIAVPGGDEFGFGPFEGQAVDPSLPDDDGDDDDEGEDWRKTGNH